MCDSAAPSCAPRLLVPSCVPSAYSGASQETRGVVACHWLDAKHLSASFSAHSLMPLSGALSEALRSLEDHLPSMPSLSLPELPDLQLPSTLAELARVPRPGSAEPGLYHAPSLNDFSFGCGAEVEAAEAAELRSRAVRSDPQALRKLHALLKETHTAGALYGKPPSPAFEAKFAEVEAAVKALDSEGGRSPSPTVLPTLSTSAPARSASLLPAAARASLSGRVGGAPAAAAGRWTG